MQKVVLGFWFLVQGLRCFPLRTIRFFLKDDLNMDASTLQALNNSVNLPLVAKPLYGIISDVFYIRGQHRIPYIAFGGNVMASVSDLFHHKHHGHLCLPSPGQPRCRNIRCPEHRHRRGAIETIRKGSKKIGRTPIVRLDGFLCRRHVREPSKRRRHGQILSAVEFPLLRHPRHDTTSPPHRRGLRELSSSPEEPFPRRHQETALRSLVHIEKTQDRVLRYVVCGV